MASSIASFRGSGNSPCGVSNLNVVSDVGPAAIEHVYLLTTQSLDYGLSMPVHAGTSLASKTQGTAQELQSILAARGTSLPTLKSSPNVIPSKKPEVSSSNTELIQEIRRENKEIERLKAELASKEPIPVAPRASSSATVVEKASSGVEEEGQALPLLNIFGIVAASVLGGYVTLQKKDAKQAQSTYELTMARDMAKISDLNTELQSMQETINKEKSLYEKLKRESSVAAAEAARQLTLERAATEAVEREKKLLEKSLEAEQRLAETMRKEARATNELLEAEKAAKFAADAEVNELENQLSQIRTALETEKSAVQKWMKEAEQTNKRLSDAQNANSSLVDENAALNETIQERQSRIDELNAAAAELESQLMNADKVNAQQQDLIKRIGKESLSMRDAMKVMRAQAAERALAAQRAADAASKDREEAIAEVKSLKADLGQERDMLARVEQELSEAKAEILRATNEANATKEELTKVRQQVNTLENQVESLKKRAEEAEKALQTEKGASESARAEIANLQSSLDALESDMANVANELSLEKEESELIVDRLFISSLLSKQSQQQFPTFLQKCNWQKHCPN